MDGLNSEFVLKVLTTENKEKDANGKHSLHVARCLPILLIDGLNNSRQNTQKLEYI